MSPDRSEMWALAAATPLTARRVLYLGPSGGAFSRAYLARHPQADVVLGPGGGGGFDAVVTEEPPDAAAASALAEGGVLVARQGAQVMAGLGLEPLSELREGAARARRPGGATLLKLQVAVFAPTLMDIRTRLPAEALASEADIAASWGKPPFSLPPGPPDQPRVLVVQRPRATDAETWRQWMALAIANGWAVVLEYDDHPELVAEVRGATLTPADWARYGWPHAVQTSTPGLAELFGRYNPEVRVFPNAVFELSPFPERPRPPRIFYGGVSRGPFAVEAARALAPAIAAHPDAHFVVAGDQAVFDALPTRAKEFHDYLPYEDYLALMGGCAISLSPLEPKPRIDTKSDAKYLDASRAGLLTIASPTVYAGTIRHGVTGLIAREMADWPRWLAAALGDPAWRGAMARAAWREVREQRMFAHQVAERRAWYVDIWRRRDALNRGIMQRLPGLDAAVLARRPS